MFHEPSPDVCDCTSSRRQCRGLGGQLSLPATFQAKKLRKIKLSKRFIKLFHIGSIRPRRARHLGN